MTRPVRYVPLAVALFVFSPAARPADDKLDAEVKKFKESLQGKWQMTARVQDGTASDADLIKKRTVVFDGDKYSVKDEGTVLGELTYKLDLSKKPAWFDVTPKDGDMAVKGIIKLDGDTLVFCVGNPEDRPDDFKSTAGSGRILGEFKRVKK